MSLFEPDKIFPRISAIDIQADFVKPGLVNVLLDIDNTVRSRADGNVPKDVRVWMGHAREAGINFCLLSNNWHSDVHEFARVMQLPIVAKAMKPLPFSFSRARKILNAPKDSLVVVGDQLFTDVTGAHLAGAKAYMVMPLAEVDLPHMRVLRHVEQALVNREEAKQHV